MSERLDTYLKEYDMLVAENRIWLSASDPKLTAGFATCVALAGAGAWNNKYPLILLIPLVVIFLGLVLVMQLDNVIRLSAQLTVLEHRINETITGGPTLSYFSRTVPAIADQAAFRDPVTGEKLYSLNAIYTAIILALLGSGAVAATIYGSQRLSEDTITGAVAYCVVVTAGTVTLGGLLWRVAKSKRAYVNLISSKLNDRLPDLLRVDWNQRRTLSDTDQSLGSE